VGDHSVQQLVYYGGRHLFKREAIICGPDTKVWFVSFVFDLKGLGHEMTIFCRSLIKFFTCPNGF
jgi:hypothetical protein